MDLLSQTEIVDERKRQLKSLERTGVESIGVLGLSAGLTMSPLTQGHNLFAGYSNIQFNFRYDEIIGREIPPILVTRDTLHPLIVERPVASSVRHRELEWRRTHMETLKQFENEWVVLEGEDIIAHGPDATQVIREAKSRGIRMPYIFFVERESDNLVRIGL
jgi:hypothetical protein